MTTQTIKSQEISPDVMRAYQAAKALHRDGGTPGGAFGLLAAIVEERTWERLTDNHSEPFPTFTAFVEAAQPGGLETTATELRKLLALRHPHEDGEQWAERAPRLRREVEALLREEIRAANPAGRPTKERATFNTVGRPDTAAKIAARLKRDDPELAEKVVAGEVSPNAAARQKGWRKPRVVLTSPASVAKKLREHFTAEQIAELAALLSRDDDTITKRREEIPHVSERTDSAGRQQPVSKAHRPEQALPAPEPPPLNSEQGKENTNPRTDHPVSLLLMIERTCRGVHHDNPELDTEILRDSVNTIEDIIGDAEEALWYLADDGCIAPPDEDTATYVTQLLLFTRDRDNLTSSMALATEITLRDLPTGEEVQP